MVTRGRKGNRISPISKDSFRFKREADKMFSSTTKNMLKNIIRHTDVHNRVVEESDCWNKYGRIRSGDESSPTPRQRSFLYDERVAPTWREDQGRGSQQAHMDGVRSSVSRSTFYTRQLARMEDEDCDRWGHSGFKELYPDEFDSDRSLDNDDSHRSRRHRRKKLKKKEKKKKKKESKKKQKSSSKSKSHKSKRKTAESESDSDNSSNSDHSSEEEERRRKEKRKRHRSDRHRVSSKRRHQDSSDSEAEFRRASNGVRSLPKEKKWERERWDDERRRDWSGPEAELDRERTGEKSLQKERKKDRERRSEGRNRDRRDHRSHRQDRDRDPTRKSGKQKRKWNSDDSSSSESEDGNWKRTKL